MKTCILSISRGFLLSITAMVVFTGSISAQPYSRLNLDANRIQWNYLLYEVKSAKADVTTEVLLESATQAETQAALIVSRRGDPVPVPAEGCQKITVNTTIDSILRPPIKSVDHLWFDPRNANGLGRFRFRQGDDDFLKRYRFTKQGVFRNQKEPKNQKEASLEPDKWTKVIDTFYSYDADRLGCPSIVDRLMMIYIATTSGIIENNQPLSLCVFGKRQLFDVKLRPAGLHPLKADYIVKKEQGEDHLQNEVKAVRIDLEAKALKSDLEKEENFSYMGFLNNISFFIDTERNLPIEIRGEIPPVGGVTLKLKEVRLRKSAG
jgi:hypothetical protein